MKVEITKRGRWQLITRNDVRELLHYKDLLYMLVKRDVTVIYKQTILGIAWAVIKPLLQMIIFTVVFGKFAGIEGKLSGGIPYAIFAFVALVPWTYFSTSLTNSTGSLVAGQVFITKVYFPRVIIPLTPILSKFIDFCIAFIVLLGMLFYYDITPNANIVYLPMLILLMMTTSLGLGMWLSAMAIQYRDINQMMMFFAQLLMYLAPVIWPISFIPEKYLLLYGLYPMAGVIEGFRSALLGVTPMPWDMIGMGSITAIVLLVSGLIYFRSKENIFADVV